MTYLKKNKRDEEERDGCACSSWVQYKKLEEKSLSVGEEKGGFDRTPEQRGKYDHWGGLCV